MVTMRPKLYQVIAKLFTSIQSIDSDKPACTIVFETDTPLEPDDKLVISSVLQKGYCKRCGSYSMTLRRALLSDDWICWKCYRKDE